MIKVLICDGDGTVGLPNPTNDTRELVAALPGLGIQLAVASNSSSRYVLNRLHQAGLPEPNLIVTPAEVGGKKKPAPEFVYRIAGDLGVALNEVAYLGDDDNTDIFCAINAGVLPFSAAYSTAPTPRQYGLPVEHPRALNQYLSTFGLQNEPYFGWSYAGTCSDTGTEIDTRALFGEHRDIGLTPYLKLLLKDQQNVPMGRNRIPLGQILFHYLASQIYLSGLVANVNYVTVYPGHLAGSHNQVLEDYSYILRRTFRRMFVPDLLIRHVDAQESRRTRGADRDVFEQFRTTHVNPQHKKKIEGKNILVLDDFTTSGASFETARRMLLKAGADMVYCLAIAKYMVECLRTNITRDWDPCIPCTLSGADIRMVWQRGTLNKAADEYFQNTIWPVYSA